MTYSKYHIWKRKSRKLQKKNKKIQHRLSQNTVVDRQEEGASRVLLLDKKHRLLYIKILKLEIEGKHMNRQELLKLLQSGESTTVEYKEAKSGMPSSLFDTVASFLNRDGGTILLGVADDGTVTGIAPSSVDKS